MEAAPPAPFKVAEPDLLFEFLIVALDAPTQFGDVNQSVEGDVLGKGRKPIFGRLVLALWSLDQQPLFRPAFGEIVIAMRHTNAHARKARGQVLGRTLPPLDRAPSALWQAEGELLD